MKTGKTGVVILISVILVVALASVALAAEPQKGTVKGVDQATGTITFCPEGTTHDMTLKADKGIDLGKVKPDMKAEIMVDKGTVKAIKEIQKPKASVGC